MEVVGVRVEMPSNQPIVLLKEIDGSRFLPIWVGAVEATAIAFAQQGVEPPRPLTHSRCNADRRSPDRDKRRDLFCHDAASRLQWRTVDHFG